MNKNTFALVASLVAVVIAASGLYIKSQVQYGAQPGPLHTEAQEFMGGNSLGHVNATSSSVATYTMVGGDMARGGAFYDTVVFTKTGAIATTTWTLAASSTLSNVIPKIGMRARTCFDVATSSQSNSGLTLIGGTGWELGTASTTESLSIEAGALGCLDIVRTGTSTTPFGFRAGLTIYRQLAE